MIILGINDSHDASACIVKDGKLLVAIAEERIQRVKGTAGFPIGAINECLDYTGIKKTDIDLIAFGSKYITPNNIWNMSATLSVHDHFSLQDDYYFPIIHKGENIKLADIFPNYKPVSRLSYPYEKIPFGMTNELDESVFEHINKMRIQHASQELNIDKDKIKFFDHHSCHAYYAFYNSNLRNKDIALVTADAGGDGLYSSVCHVKNGQFIEIHRARNNLIGKIYSSITLLLGMKPNEHEFKVMGLAPYASELQKKGPRKVFDECLKVNGLDFVKNEEMIDHFQYFKERLKGFRFDGIAGALQDFTEALLSEWFENISKQLNTNDFVYCGGISNNIKANKAISEKNFVKSFFVPAAPSDENLSIGACYMAIYEEYGYEAAMEIIQKNSTAYWGPSITATDINLFSNNEYITKHYERKENVDYEQLADILSKGEIIAVCFDNMEFGSRALGHRSLIADPSNPESLKKINELIKKRDFWMPFTPSIIDYKYDDYLVNKKDLPTSFMTMSFDTKSMGKKNLISAIHPYDQTVRPQKVSIETCPRYYKLIDYFYKKTGVGAVLNTSLNIHGKPIVNHPIEIVNEILMQNIPLNYILINDNLFSRKS